MLAAAEVGEAMMEGTGAEGSADIVDVEVHPNGDAAAEVKAVGKADLRFPETEQVVEGMILVGEQKQFDSVVRIDL